ncbi:MAG: hypothetical protein CMJ94_15030 [Planctomycetes bacterium]|nr:hypothetical protein [Planctomycetota bacterium]
MGILAAALFALPLAMPQSDSPAPQKRTEPTSLAPVQGVVEQPVELGQVRWRRDLDAALAEAKAADKPVLLLFQEVPG